MADSRLEKPFLTLETASFILRLLVDKEPASDSLSWSELLQDEVGAWLVQVELGPLAHAKLARRFPRLAASLQADLFSAVAALALQSSNLKEIETAFVANKLKTVVLKGAALGDTVYMRPEWRIMSDIDLWLDESQINLTKRTLNSLGYQLSEESLSFLSHQLAFFGEAQFHRSTPGSLVEIHTSPFKGWWLRRTAVVDEAGIWARREPLPNRPFFYQMAAEDMVIHLAVHLAIGHQYGTHTMRTLVDIALTMQKREIDLEVVVQRARQWRVATAVYATLNLVHQFIGFAELEFILEALKPNFWQQRLLNILLPPSKLLYGLNLSYSVKRFPLLICLIDRPSDMFKLIFRTIWPEREWLRGRYKGNVGNLRHLWRILRYGEV